MGPRLRSGGRVGSSKLLYFGVCPPYFVMVFRMPFGVTVECYTSLLRTDTKDVQEPPLLIPYEHVHEGFIGVYAAWCSPAD